MAKQQRLMLQQVLNEIFMETLSGDDEEVPNKVTDTRNTPVRSTSYQTSGFH